MELRKEFGVPKPAEIKLLKELTGWVLNLSQ